jgi:hypothetical protein
MMSRPEIMLEVTQPFHKSGTEVLYQPGERFPLGAELPEGVSVRQVIVDVPDAPEPKAAAAPRGPGRPRKQETS